MGTNWADDPNFGDIFAFSPLGARAAVTSRLARNWPVADSRTRRRERPGSCYTRALGTRTNYDEGVYLASLDAMRRGQELGTELYTSQPPVFYWLLRALAAPFGSSIPDIRFAFALLAIVGVAAAIALGWRLYGPPGRSGGRRTRRDRPSVPVGRADGVGRRARRGTRARVARARRRSRSGAAPRAHGPVPRAAVLALAVLTKLLAIPFVVPFLALALAARAARRVLPAALVGAALAALVVAAATAGALDDIWRQVVTDHTEARNLGTLSGNVDQILKVLEPRTPFGWLVPLGFLAFVTEPPCAPDLAAVDVRAGRGRIPPSRPPARRSPPGAALRRVRRSRQDRASRSRSAGCARPRGPSPRPFSCSSSPRGSTRSSDACTGTTSPIRPR